MTEMDTEQGGGSAQGVALLAKKLRSGLSGNGFRDWHAVAALVGFRVFRHA